MHTYHATVRWARGADEFLSQRYSRGHTWEFDEGLAVPASASPLHVRAPWHVTKAVDPEEAMIAATSSCHMLFFLSYASAAGFTVDAYEDSAETVMGKDAQGRDMLTEFVLRPLVTFRERAPSEEEFMAMHHKAHEACYVANTLKSPVRCEPVIKLVSASR